MAFNYLYCFIVYSDEKHFFDWPR